MIQNSLDVKFYALLLRSNPDICITLVAQWKALLLLQMVPSWVDCSSCPSSNNAYSFFLSHFQLDKIVPIIDAIVLDMVLV